MGLASPLEPMTQLALTSWVATLDGCTEQALARTYLDLDQVVTWAVDRLLQDVERSTAPRVD